MNGLIDRLVNVVPPLLAVLVAWRAAVHARKARKDVQKLHVEVDGRLTQLLETTSEAAGAAGELRGRASERTERTEDDAGRGG